MSDEEPGKLRLVLTVVGGDIVYNSGVLKVTHDGSGLSPYLEEGE